MVWLLKLSVSSLLSSACQFVQVQGYFTDQSLSYFFFSAIFSLLRLFYKVA